MCAYIINKDKWKNIYANINTGITRNEYHDDEYFFTIYIEKDSRGNVIYYGKADCCLNDVSLYMYDLSRKNFTCRGWLENYIIKETLIFNDMCDVCCDILVPEWFVRHMKSLCENYQSF